MQGRMRGSMEGREGQTPGGHPGGPGIARMRRQVESFSVQCWGHSRSRRGPRLAGHVGHAPAGQASLGTAARSRPFCRKPQRAEGGPRPRRPGPRSVGLLAEDPPPGSRSPGMRPRARIRRADGEAGSQRSIRGARHRRGGTSDQLPGAFHRAGDAIPAGARGRPPRGTHDQPAGHGRVSRRL